MQFFRPWRSADKSRTRSNRRHRSRERLRTRIEFHRVCICKQATRLWQSREAERQCLPAECWRPRRKRATKKFAVHPWRYFREEELSPTNLEDLWSARQLPAHLCVLSSFSEVSSDAAATRLRGRSSF